MKITAIADCHLNKTSYKDDESYMFTSIPFRSQDFMNSFCWMVDKNINEIKPDLFLILGDIYDTFDPSNIVSAFFNEQLRKLSDAKIPVIILVGNHDICSKHHALLPLLKLNLKNIKVIENPQTIKFKDKLLMLFPYSVDVEKKNITIKEQFNQFVAKTKEQIINTEDWHNLDVIFLGHFGVKGAYVNKYNTDGGQKLVLNENDHDISVADLDTIGAKYVLLGDYHKHQILPTSNCLAMYPGSIERTDMSEANDKKGFVFYDSEKEVNDKYEKFTFVEYPNTRPMIDLVGNLQDIYKTIDKLGSESKGAIVRLTVKGSAQEIVEFDIGQHELIKKLNAKIEPAYTKKQNKMVDNDRNKKVEEIEKKISSEGHITSSEVIDVVKDTLSERESNKEELRELVNIAENVYEVAQLKMKV